MSEGSYEAPRGTIYVERKISDNKYGSHVFGLHYPVLFDIDAPVAEQTQAVLDAFEAAKAIIATQSEPLLAALVEADFARPAPAATGGRTAPASGNTSPTVELFCEKDAKVTTHFDNRSDIASGRAKPRSPKFKCKVCRNGVWDIPEALKGDESSVAASAVADKAEAAA